MLSDVDLRVISTACPNLEDLLLERVQVGGPLTGVVFPHLTELTLESICGDFNPDTPFPLDTLAPSLQRLSITEAGTMFERGPLRHSALRHTFYDTNDGYGDAAAREVAEYMMSPGRLLPEVYSMECCFDTHAFTCDAHPVTGPNGPDAGLRRASVQSCLFGWFSQWTQLQSLKLSVADSSFPISRPCFGSGAPPLHVLLPILGAALGDNLWDLDLVECVLGRVDGAQCALLCLPLFIRLRSLRVSF